MEYNGEAPFPVQQTAFRAKFLQQFQLIEIATLIYLIQSSHATTWNRRYGVQMGAARMIGSMGEDLKG